MCRKKPANFLIVSDHFVGLTLKGLNWLPTHFMSLYPYSKPPVSISDLKENECCYLLFSYIYIFCFSPTNVMVQGTFPRIIWCEVFSQISRKNCSSNVSFIIKYSRKNMVFSFLSYVFNVFCGSVNK